MANSKTDGAQFLREPQSNWATGPSTVDARPELQLQVRGLLSIKKHGMPEQLGTLVINTPASMRLHAYWGGISGFKKSAVLCIHWVQELVPSQHIGAKS